MSSLKNPCLNIPTQASPFQNWVEWHKKLKSQFGKGIANNVWVDVWSVRGSSQANTGELREYLGSQGIVIDKSAWDSIVDTTGDITDFIGGAFTFGKYISYFLIGAAALAVIILIYQIAFQPFKAVGAAAQFAGAGAVKGVGAGSTKFLNG